MARRIDDNDLDTDSIDNMLEQIQDIHADIKLLEAQRCAREFVKMMVLAMWRAPLFWRPPPACEEFPENVQLVMLRVS